MAFRIPLIKPYVTQEIIDRVVEVLKGRYLTEGPTVREFERIVTDYVGSKHSIAFTSNTTGMETALRACGIGPGDEVLVPDYTYPATATVVQIVGATPVLVDIDRRTANIDYAQVRSVMTDRTKAILPVSLFGNPLDYTELKQLKDDFGVWIIEDAACSLGAESNEKKVGSLADASVFSFHPRKFITTGEGGMVTTNDDELAKFMISYKNFGMAVEDFKPKNSFLRMGTNYKMSNVLGAIGVMQMKVIDELLTKRRELCDRYNSLLEDVQGIGKLLAGRGHSYQSYCILVPNRDKVMQEMRSRGIEVQIGTYALHKEAAFKSCKKAGSLENSAYVADRALVLPLFHDLTAREQEEIVGALRELVR